MTNNITLSNDLGGLKFGIDSNGNYGYYKDGADTVTPFKKVDFIQNVTFTPDNFTQTVDCKSLVGYENLTADDFLLDYVSFKTSGSASYNYNSGITKTYDSTTGILTIKRGNLPGQAYLTLGVYVI